jgi:hypothetical protein
MVFVMCDEKAWVAKSPQGEFSKMVAAEAWQNEKPF